jgi:glycopeptide antibiotics resistance protein
VLKSVAKKRQVKTQDLMCVVGTLIFGVYNSVSVKITVLISVIRKHLVKAKTFM